MLSVDKINVKEVYDLSPIYENRKSYYGKAHVIVDKDGNKYLRSYDTIVCYVDSDKTFIEHGTDIAQQLCDISMPFVTCLTLMAVARLGGTSSQ